MVYPLFKDARNLVFLLALLAVAAKRTSINGDFSHFAEKMNDHQRKVGATGRSLPEIPLGERVKYYDAVFLGVDSLMRTSDCWQEMKGNDFFVDIHYGFHLMTIMLPNLVIDGKNMSGYVRIRDNSINLAYTVHNTSEKCITLKALNVEKMENVQFGASRADYDGTSVDGFFKLVLKPTLNKIVWSNKAKIEATLEALCRIKDFKNDGPVEQLVMSLF